jgi:predicted Na+-dependent transporter
MEKRIIGILLTLLGVIGLIVAGYYFMNTGKGSSHFKSIIMYGILGLIFFVSGIGLIKNTSDKAT